MEVTGQKGLGWHRVVTPREEVIQKKLEGASAQRLPAAHGTRSLQRSPSRSCLTLPGLELLPPKGHYPMELWQNGRPKASQGLSFSQ